MTSLAVTYLGRQLSHPFILASAPPTANGEMIARGFAAGWAGAVVKTLVQEPARNLHHRYAVNRLGGGIYGFENIELASERAPEAWFSDMRTLKRSFPDRLLIGSIMGTATDRGPWLDLALGCQEAGADLLELNFSCPHGHPEKGQGAAIGQNADYSARITRWLKEEPRLRLPVIPKLTAAVTDIAAIGQAVAAAGADGLCAINTIPSVMGFDLKTLAPRPAVRGYSTAGGYSGPGIKPIALHCVADLARSPGLPIMACGGIASGFDAAEFLLLGAPVVQVCTAVMLGGYGVLERMQAQLAEFMGWHGFSTVEDFRGQGLARLQPFHALDASYRVRAHIDPVRCKSCGTCYLSCRDAGYQAIQATAEAVRVDAERCQGCSLCAQVCPHAAIRMVELGSAGR